MQYLGRQIEGRIAVRELKGNCSSSRICHRSCEFSDCGKLEAHRSSGAPGWVSKIGRIGIVLVLLSLSAVYGATLPGTSVTLSWNGSADANIAGYQVYVGTQSGNYTSIVPAAGTTATISGLADGATYYFAVTALNDLGMESGFSNEIIYTVPTTRPKLQLLLSPTKQIILRITGQPLHVYEIQASQDMRNWNVVGLVTLGLSVNLDFIDTTATGRPARFYRLREIL